MTCRVIECREETDCYFTKRELAESEAEALYRRYKDWFDVKFPSPITDGRFCIRSKGYVGTFPITDDLMLRVTPKLPIDSIFRMLEHAYDLKTFKLYDGRADAGSIDDLFETLAHILARRVLDRARRGLQKDYIEINDDLPYVRGRLRFRETLRNSLAGGLGLACEFDHHTPELEDNHILAWTLHRIRTLPIRREEVRNAVRKANQALQMTVDLKRVPAHRCVGRFYHALNHDYEPMHALCRFFLEQCGPTLAAGGREMIPFSLYMPGLFEAFVARWLAQSLAPRYGLEVQHHTKIDEAGDLSFKIDLVLADRGTGKTLAVLDTKYKDAVRMDNSDVKQMVAYAVSMRTDKMYSYLSREYRVSQSPSTMFLSFPRVSICPWMSSPPVVSSWQP